MPVDVSHWSECRAVNRVSLAEIVSRPDAAFTVEPVAVPGLLAELEGLRAKLWARLLAPARRDRDDGEQSAPDRLLNPAEAAKLMGVTPRWLYRHASRLPFARRLSRKALRFSEAGLRRRLAAHRGL